MTVTLTGKSKIAWARPDGCPAGFEPLEVVVGNSDVGGMALEVAIARWSKSESPTRDALTRLHTLRTNKRATPVVLVVEFDSGGTLVFGPNAAAAPVGPLPADQTQRVVQAALDEPTVVAARSRLAGLVQAIDTTSMPGIKNSGLFANHELRVGVPQRPDWKQACTNAAPMLSLKGKALIEKLGFQAGQFGAHALLLTGAGPKAEAIAVLLDEREAFDADSPRFTVSPVAYGLNMAEKQGVPWLIMVRGSQIRLYSSRKDFGVGRKGLAETFFEVDLPQLTTANAGYLQLIFSAAALAEGGTTYEILKSSSQYAVALGERLRDKVYEEIVPKLSVAVAEALVRNGTVMDAKGLDLAYQLTLRIFFRMLFQVYAEDRKLLPYGENTKYDRNAIKTVAKDLAENPEQIFDENSTSLWDDLSQVWRVIDSGDKAWGVPAYNGGLFASDSELSEHGAILKDIQITNDVMGPILRALLLDDTEDGVAGPVDFRSLSVREFGTIYEGLLESSLALAEVDLTLDSDGTWLPAKKEDEVIARKGEVYFHNTSGQRKGTGSYFTPSFVVEHLLERSLGPALDAHLAHVAALLGEGDHAGAAEKFFDFRVADLAMGSGHFLTSAIDHVEQKMAAFLAGEGQSIPGVAAELLKLEVAARAALGDDSWEVERSSLLRRQIARRCIYGLDINPIAVELARVSIWIHTFVRGLPMSSLDHNLVCANSLTGIGSVDEALDVLVPSRAGQASLFDEPIVSALERSRDVLIDAALLSESTKDESRAASRAAKKAYKDAETARLLFDAAVLNRVGRGDLVSAIEPSEIVKLAALASAQDVVAPMQPAHMPALFPEVFLRENSGFDVLIGNPPWKQLMVDELRFWLRAEPGILALGSAELKKKLQQLKRTRSDLAPEFEREVALFDSLRDAITAGPYPGVGGGGRAPDLFHAFAWRNWQLLRVGGRLGAVFPRTLLMSAVCADWREEVLSHGEVNVVTVTNSSEWVFKGVDGRYSITFVDICKASSQSDYVQLSGPFYDYETFSFGRHQVGKVPVALLRIASEGTSIPQLPDAESAEVFSQLRKSARVSDAPEGFRFRPMYEFNATTDRPVFDAGQEKEGRWPVYGGSSFDIWRVDAGDPYAWSEPKKVIKALQDKRKRQVGLKSSAFYGFGDDWARDEKTLPCMAPRIAFRDVTNATNSRTCIPCLVPGELTLTNKAPYLVRIDATPKEEAFVLGVLSSIPLDWYARRFVELGLNFPIFNSLPMPFGDLSDPRRARVVEIAGRLAAVDSRFSTWAKKVGVRAGSVKSVVEKEELIAELDALVAHLYELSRRHLEHIFRTFHRGWDFSSRLNQVLNVYDELPDVKK